MREFKFFHGYSEKTLFEQWEDIMDQYPTTITEWGNIPVTTNPVWHGTTYTPTWVVNPGLIQYTPPNYTITTTPNYYGTGYITIPYSGTITTGTATGFSLTTSNTNGTTYTTGGFGGTLTTNTAFLNTEILTGTSTSSTNFK